MYLVNLALGFFVASPASFLPLDFFVDAPTFFFLCSALLAAPDVEATGSASVDSWETEDGSRW